MYNPIIFNRGEYLRLVEGNQDNYIEECLKIRNVLVEFEECSISSQSPQAQWLNFNSFKRAPLSVPGSTFSLTTLVFWAIWLLEKNIRLVRELAESCAMDTQIY